MDEIIVSVDDIVVSEGSTFAEFVVRLNRAASQDVIVQYNTQSGTADTLDYDSINTQSLVFASGETQKIVRVQLEPDTAVDPIESFYLNLFQPSTQSGVAIAHSRALATIIDNDNLLSTPVLSMYNVVVDEAARTANFVFTLNGRSNSEISMLVSTVNGTATAGTDFTALVNQRVTFAPGQTSVTVTVPITNDNLAEVAESFSLRISSLTGATSFQDVVTARINDSDQPTSQSVVVQVDDIVVSEGSLYAEFVVRLNKPSTGLVTINYDTQVATADTLDYDSTFNQTLVFASGETLKTIRIPLEPDTAVDGSNVFYLLLSQPDNQAGVTFEKSLVTATIIDNDSVSSSPLLTVSDAIVDESAGVANFVLTLNARSNSEVTMLISTLDGSAVAGSDYSRIDNMKISFAPGQTSLTVSVPIFNDNLQEIQEAFSLVVSNLNGATLFDNIGTATIAQSDQLAAPVVTVSVDDVVIGEKSQFAEFTFRLDKPSASDLTVLYTTLVGTAGTLDYDSISTRSVVFAAGQTLKTVRIPIVDDNLAEQSEVFYLGISQPDTQTGLNIARSLVTATIIDNDTLLPTPVLSISGATVDEAAGVANFVLTLNARTNSEVTMLVSTQNGTATAGQDYTALLNQRVSFEPGQTAVTISVPILNDNLVESSEAFSLVISELVGASNFQNAAAVTIEQNDQIAQQVVLVKVDDPVVDESAGFVEFIFRLDNPSTKNIVVNYSTQVGTAGTLDYDSQGNQSLVFVAGETVKTIRVPIDQDTAIEGTEVFYLNLSQPGNQSGVVLEKALVTATIVDDDVLLNTPILSISDPIVDEQAGLATFVLTLNGRTNSAVNMLVSTQSGTAVAGEDFAGIINQRVSFAPGETAVTVTVPILKDSIQEGSESFSLVVSNLTGATSFQNAGVATIVANDKPSQGVVLVQADDVVVSESNGFAEFVISLNAPSTKNIAVNYSLFPATAGTLDYDSVNTQQVVFFAGETVKTVRIPLFQDTLQETNEAFYIQLSQPSGQTDVLIEKSLLTATVVDNDTVTVTPVLSISSVYVDENSNTANFVITLNTRTNSEVTMVVSTVDGTATAGSDYTAIVGKKISFIPGQTAVTVSVPILNDNLTEIAESFSLVINELVGATAFENTGVATIGLNDLPQSPNVIVSVDDITVGEGDGFAEFIVKLDRPADKPIQIFYSAQSGTAGTIDFASTGNQSLVFAAGETAKTFRVPLDNDNTVENAETFFIRLTQSDQQTGVFLEKSLVSATIIDNDSLLTTPQLTIRNVFVDEATSTANFVLSLNGRSNNEVSMLVSTRDGTAKAGSDYTAISAQKVSFAPGQTTVTVSVPILNDAISEVAEMFSLDISDIRFATAANPTATARIAASDIEANPQVRVFVENIAVSENDPYAEFVVQLNRPSTQFIELEYSTRGLTASSASDFNSIFNQTLAFAPGETVSTIRVPLLRDNITEQPETFELNITVPSAMQQFVNLSKGTAIATIFDSSTTVPTFNPTGPVTVINGSNGNDSFQGTANNESFNGGNGNDTLAVSAGRDSFNGGAGRDTLIVGNLLLDVVDFSFNGTNPDTRTVTIRDESFAFETSLVGVERLQFGDFAYAFDFEADQSAGGVYRVYQAAFNRRPDLDGLGFWIGKSDQGVSIKEIAVGFVNSVEFERVYDLKLNDAFASGQDIEKIVGTFYNNVLGRAPEKEGFDYWVGVLRSKADTVANVLGDFANSTENKANLVGVLQDGFEYITFVG